MGKERALDNQWNILEGLLARRSISQPETHQANVSKLPEIFLNTQEKSGRSLNENYVGLAHPNRRTTPILPAFGDSPKNLENKAFGGGLLKILGFVTVAFVAVAVLYAGIIKAFYDAAKGIIDVFQFGAFGNLILDPWSLVGILPLAVIALLITALLLFGRK